MHLIKLLIYTSSRHGVTLAFIWSRVSGHLTNDKANICFVSSGLHHTLREISGSYAAKCSTMFTIAIVADIVSVLFGAGQAVFGGFVRGWWERRDKAESHQTKTMSSKTLKRPIEQRGNAKLSDRICGFTTKRDPFHITHIWSIVNVEILISAAWRSHQSTELTMSWQTALHWTHTLKLKITYKHHIDVLASPFLSHGENTVLKYNFVLVLVFLLYYNSEANILLCTKYNQQSDYDVLL